MLAGAESGSVTATTLGSYPHAGQKGSGRGLPTWHRSHTKRGVLGVSGLRLVSEMIAINNRLYAATSERLFQPRTVRQQRDCLISALGCLGARRSRQRLKGSWLWKARKTEEETQEMFESLACRSSWIPRIQILSRTGLPREPVPLNKSK